jgi:hypothetical protein
VYLKIANHTLKIESEDLCRVSEQNWKTAYGPCHIIFVRDVGTKYHPRKQSLGSFILRSFQEVEFVNPKQFKNFSKSNLKVVTR